MLSIASAEEFFGFCTGLNMPSFDITRSSLALAAMPESTRGQLDFGNQKTLEASLSQLAGGLRLSGILKIANEVRALVASGRSVVNLTVGDFNPLYFPIPKPLLEEIRGALAAGATNYPPQPGLLALREAVRDYVERSSGVHYPLESILITSGGRPVIYAAFRILVSPGEKVVYSVPSWQNDSYSWLSGADEVVITADAANGFQPTLEEIAPHLTNARMLCLCSPGNPTGTAMDPAVFKSILEAVVRENARRESTGKEKPLFLLYDQIYGAIRVRNKQHCYAAALVPEAARYVITMDGVSKAFAGTGLRVGWLIAAPAIVSKMGELLAHMGAWAPHAEQAGVAKWLRNEEGIRQFRKEMDDKLQERLQAVYSGFAKMRDDGYPVDCINPEGAIYVSLQLKIKGRTIDGKKLETNEDIRSVLLEKTGVAIVQFQAFGLPEDSGWFRLSVGAVSMEQIAEMFPRIRAMLDEVK
jgi:aspartate aminotransferase